MNFVTLQNSLGQSLHARLKKTARGWGNGEKRVGMMRRRVSASREKKHTLINIFGFRDNRSYNRKKIVDFSHTWWMWNTQLEYKRRFRCSGRSIFLASVFSEVRKGPRAVRGVFWQTMLYSFWVSTPYKTRDKLKHRS